MNKRVYAVLAACILIITLSGCQLALPEKSTQQDQLCGIFITFEPLPSPLDEMNGEMSLREFQELMQSKAKIYAVKKTSGSPSAMPDYFFEGIEGLRFMELYISDEQGGCYTSQVDPGVDGVHISVGNDAVELTGKLMLDIRFNRTIYANPVYLTQDGQVYMVQGDGVSYGGRTDAGDWGSTTIEETRTQTENGEKTSRAFRLELKIVGINPLQEAVLKRMDANDSLIAQTLITQDTVPESILLEKDTAYMVVEEHRLDWEGNPVTERSLLNVNEDELICRFSAGNGIVTGSGIKLNHTRTEAF